MSQDARGAPAPRFYQAPAEGSTAKARGTRVSSAHAPSVARPKGWRPRTLVLRDRACAMRAPGSGGLLVFLFLVAAAFIGLYALWLLAHLVTGRVKRRWLRYAGYPIALAGLLISARIIYVMIPIVWD